MSAIFGIISKKGKPVEQEDINKIQQAIAHRTTHGKGLWYNGNAALGFCKLSVYPQQQNEQLPIDAGDLILTADARIDNRDELYSLLNLDKQQWQNEANSYLILKAYQKWGNQCVDHLQGEFAFAVWNKINQELFVTTDQIGFRPVFYYDGPEQFVFCSEIKGVVAAKTSPNYFNEENLINYHFRQSDHLQTFNSEVFKLGAGNALVLNNDKIQLKKYWTLEATGRYNFSSDQDWIDCMRNLMYKAVEKRLSYDVPVGVTLSGGLDSSSIACILSELLAKKNKPLYAFSSVLAVNHGGVEVDERSYIEMVGKHCPNIIQTFVEAPNVGPFDNVEEAFIKDENFPNGFFYMDQALLQAAQQKNIRSLFTGFGGDFWVSWAGRSAVYSLLRQGNYNTAAQLIRQLSVNYNTNILSLFKSDYLIHTKAWQQLHKLKPNKGIDWQKQTALKSEFVDKFKQGFGSTSISDQRLNMKKTFEGGRVAHIMGMFANRNSWYGMSSCDPMFDKDLMEFLMEVPYHLFNKNGWRRSLIRHAMQGVLPPDIQWRRDKLPYNPDFIKRIINSRQKLYDMINAPESAFVFDSYFSKEIIDKHFDDIKPFAGFSNPNAVGGIRMIQAGISTKVLCYLKENGYLFS